jgi:hypothetical protein
MTASRSHRVLIAIAILCLISIEVASGEKVIRMAYRFAFEDEGILNAGRQPTQKEVEAVLCQSNVFFSKSLQEKVGNSAIVAVAKEADFAFENFVHKGDGGVPISMPASINFTLDVTTIDGSTLPPMTDILDDFLTFDYHAYLTKHVWKAAPVTKNFFFEARGVVWHSAIVDEVKGNITEVNCPEGATPEAMASSASGPGLFCTSLLS